jgi:MFS family permease
MTITDQPPGIWAPAHRRLTVGLVLTVTLVAFESLSVATVLPVVGRELGDIHLYGWVFSAFFLASLVGIVVAGQQADKGGLGRPFALGLILFAAGLAIGGAATNMLMLVAGRAVQGLGAGAIPAAAYVAIGRGYDQRSRPRMFAVLSTAWVVPGLVGPAASGWIADHVGWRWVFLGLLPIVAVSAVLTLPSVGGAHLAPPATGTERTERTEKGNFWVAVRVATGAALFLAGLTVASPLVTALLIVAGIAVGLPAYRRLVPPGTLRARTGLPAAILVRGLLTFCFFGADAYVPLTLTSVRGASPTMAGVALTVSTLSWTIGSWIQERRVRQWGARPFIRTGFVLIAIAIAGLPTLLSRATPLVLGPVYWAVGGLGIGLAYAPISLTVLKDAPPGQEGRISAALTLTDVLGTALGTGVCGAAVGLGWDRRAGLGTAFAIAFVVAAIGILLAGRVPRANLIDA